MRLKKPFRMHGSEEALSLATIADALAHPLRYALLDYVHKNQGIRNDVCNKDLVAHFPYSQSSLSQHIKKLKDAGLFTVVPRDKFSHYYVNKEKLQYFLDHISKLTHD